MFDITIQAGERFGVDLRELHGELESKKQFGSWAKDKLRRFTQGVDFQPATQSLTMVTRPQGGGRVAQEYVVTVECAKHIAMMENTERGAQVRQYFIKIEAAYREAMENQALETAADPDRLPTNEELVIERMQKGELENLAEFSEWLALRERWSPEGVAEAAESNAITVQRARGEAVTYTPTELWLCSIARKQAVSQKGAGERFYTLDDLIALHPPFSKPDDPISIGRQISAHAHTPLNMGNGIRCIWSKGRSEGKRVWKCEIVRSVA